MRNEAAWKETKFTRDRRGRWRASRANIPITSRLVGDLAASAYARAIETHARGRLADLGCGTVPLYGMYKSRVTDVTCIDWGNSLHDSEHIDMLADLNARLDIAPESFDTVIASDVIEHLSAPQIFFDSTARILKSGGKLIIGVPFLYWIHEAPHDYFRYTRFGLEKLARDAGLTIVSLVSYGGSPEVLSDIATKSVGRRSGLAWPVYWLTRAMLALPPVKFLSSRTRESMPMGYVLVAEKP